MLSVESSSSVALGGTSFLGAWAAAATALALQRPALLVTELTGPPVGRPAGPLLPTRQRARRGQDSRATACHPSHRLTSTFRRLL